MPLHNKSTNHETKKCLKSILTKFAYEMYIITTNMMCRIQANPEFSR